MYYSLIGNAPQSNQDLLLQNTDPLFQLNVPISNPPSIHTTKKELQFILQTIDSDWENNLPFITAADLDFISLFLALISELGIQDDREAELRNISSSLAVPLMKIKYHYNRARPFQYAQHFNMDFPIFPTVSGHSPSYPSGHTTQALFLAKYLSSIYPNHRKIFMDLANDISFSRIQAGLHFPSDSIFGAQLANILWNGPKGQCPPTMKLSSFKNKEHRKLTIWDQFRYI